MPFMIIKYLHFYFCVVANIIGVAVCELSSVYLGELYTWSSFAGSLPLIVFSRWLALDALRLLEARCPVSRFSLLSSGSVNFWGRAKGYVLDFAHLATFGLIVALFIHLSSHPFFLLGIDRVAYSQLYLTGIWGTISSWLSILIVVPILCIRVRRSRVAFLTVAIYALTLFWTGVKFGSYFALLCAFAIVFYDKICCFDKRRVSQILCAILVVLTVLVLMASSIQTVYTQRDASEYLPARIAQQGELWWRVYDLYGQEPHPTQITNELANITTDETVSDSVGAKYGIYNVMYLSAPSFYIDRYLSGGARYTEGGYASALYSLGFSGTVLFSLAIALLTYFVQTSLIRAVVADRPMATVLIYRLYIITSSAIVMGVFGQFFNSMSLCSYLLLFIIWISTSARQGRVFCKGLRRSARGDTL